MFKYFFVFFQRLFWSGFLAVELIQDWFGTDFFADRIDFINNFVEIENVVSKIQEVLRKQTTDLNSIASVVSVEDLQF